MCHKITYKGVEYKNRRDFYQHMHPDIDAKLVDRNDIDMFFYHFCDDFREHRKMFYRDRYRKGKETVRRYKKFESHTDPIDLGFLAVRKNNDVLESNRNSS